MEAEELVGTKVDLLQGLSIKYGLRLLKDSIGASQVGFEKFSNFMKRLWNLLINKFSRTLDEKQGFNDTYWLNFTLPLSPMEAHQPLMKPSLKKNMH